MATIAERSNEPSLVLNLLSVHSGFRRHTNTNMPQDIPENSTTVLHHDPSILLHYRKANTFTTVVTEHNIFFFGRTILLGL